MSPATTSAGVLESRSPATGEVLGQVATVRPEDVQRVVDDVAQVQPFWAQLSLPDRGRYLRRTAQAIVDEGAEIRDLIAREQGKPRNEAFTMEVLPTIDALHWIAGQGARILGDERLPTPQVFLKTKRAHVTYDPLGVIGVISPWNYPWSIPLGEVAMALMTGNGVVLKPSSLTPLLGERIRHVFERAGLPEGIVQVVHGGGHVGQALVESSVAKILFTGSVAVGRGVAEACARQLKGCVLELGGKDPMLVLADVNVEHAIAGALWGGFANAGQTCAGIERVYVAREVAERFTAGVVGGARRLTAGDPLGWDTAIGPMTSREQFELVRDLVDDAVSSGATLECGGPVRVPGLAGDVYAPAVLTGVTHDMRIMREEVFGPVLPVVTVEDEDEALRLANDSDFGLGASIWTTDRLKGERMARELDTGMVWLNDHLFSHGAMQMPWGGEKHSGLGRSHSRFGFYECVNVKLRVWNAGRARDLWWHPYDETLGQAMLAAARLLYGRESERLGALRAGALPLAKVLRRTLRRG